MSKSIDQNIKKRNASEEEKSLKNTSAEWEENPELEDPRLFSPLQEPDTPSPQERILMNQVMKKFIPRGKRKLD